MDDLVLYIHIASLCVAAAGMFYADSQAFGWLIGKKDLLLHTHLKRAHDIVGFALVGLITTGLALFWPMREYLVEQPMFWAKMGFVLALVVNAFAIERLMHVPTRSPFHSLRKKEKLSLMISGAVSAVSWLGAAGLALLLFD